MNSESCEPIEDRYQWRQVLVDKLIYYSEFDYEPYGMVATKWVMEHGINYLKLDMEASVANPNIRCGADWFYLTILNFIQESPLRDIMLLVSEYFVYSAHRITRPHILAEKLSENILNTIRSRIGCIEYNAECAGLVCNFFKEQQ